MKLFGYYHMFCPLHNAGSEVTVYVALAEMVRRGHQVTVVADRTPEDYSIDGIKVLSPPRHDQWEWLKNQARDADLIVTHLDCTVPAMQLALDIQKPLAHFVHNHMQLNFHRVNPHKAQLLIFNSDWIANKQQWEDRPDHFVPWPGESVVVHPIVEPERYRCKPGNKITLCNPTDGKGISTLHKLSEAMPDYEFLVVAGIYGEQIAPPNLGDEWVKAHPNVEHMENTPDVKEVFRKTKVVLMPSNYESYGRVAVEATCAGIPSIVHPTEGLLEALGAERTPTDGDLKGGWVSGAGIFCDRADIESWRAQIERLYKDEVYYRSRSDAALKLAAGFDPEAEFDRLERALVKTATDWKFREGNMKPVMLSNRRLGRTADGQLTDNMAAAQSLVCGSAGHPIPDEFCEQAMQKGFTDTPSVPAVQTEPLLDTKELAPEYLPKAISAPPEDKAQKAPEENKAKKRKNKAA